MKMSYLLISALILGTPFTVWNTLDWHYSSGFFKKDPPRAEFVPNYDEIEQARSMCDAGYGAAFVIKAGMGRNYPMPSYAAEFLSQVAADIKERGWSARLGYNGWCAVFVTDAGLPSKPLSGDEIRRLRGGDALPVPRPSPITSVPAVPLGVITGPTTTTLTHCSFSSGVVIAHNVTASASGGTIICSR